MSNFGFDFDSAADEDFFGNLRKKSSKLQQLLDDDTLSDAEKQQSLKYQRPKATDLKNSQKKDSTPEQSSAGSSVCTLLAKVSTAYSQGKLQGKVGVALIKSTDNSLQIILYKTKDNVLATLQLADDRQSIFKQQRYWQFYDDTTKVDWSFCFESSGDENDFQDLLLKNGQQFQVAYEDTNVENQEIEKFENIAPNNDNADEIIASYKPETSSDSVSHKDSTKSSLIRRMAKMGQPLPNLSGTSLQKTTTEFSDSSDTEVIKTPLSVPQKPCIAPRSNKLASLKNSQAKHVIPSTMAFSTAPVYTTISNNLESQYMQMLLTEQRTQGSELRMNVQKLETKIEKVLDKLDYMERGTGVEVKNKPYKDDEILELEEKILNLKKENRKLKQMQEHVQQMETYEGKSKKVIGMLGNELNSMGIEETNDLEKLLKMCVQKIREEQETVQKQQKNIDELKQTKIKLEDSFKLQQELNGNLEKQLEDLKQKELEYKCNSEDKDQLIYSLEQQIEQLKMNLKEETNKHIQNSQDNVVKTIMNNLYSDICSRITTEDCGDLDKVLALVGSAIKQQTLKALKPPQSASR